MGGGYVPALSRATLTARAGMHHMPGGYFLSGQRLDIWSYGGSGRQTAPLRRVPARRGTPYSGRGVSNLEANLAALRTPAAGI